MPVYDYDCADCGAFTGLAPMSEASAPAPCPACAAPARRVIRTAPVIAGMDAGLRRAHATNERASHAPLSTRQTGHVHSATCGCGSKKTSGAVHHPNGAKTFPSKRPWMISH